MKNITLTALVSTASLLAACGGGGSGSDPVAGPATPAAPAAPVPTTVALSGTAAKGLMTNADVGVYAVGDNGSPADTPLVSTTTDTQGRYALSFPGLQGKPYIVKVSAKADGSTTHADEISGQAQALPAGFQMRSVLVTRAAGNITASASITPFSEMAVAAAARANGGVTADNARQAISTVSQLLGFDPTAVSAKALASDNSADEKKLAVMLTAVSQLAASGALGCSSTSGGDKTKCVVDALSASASKDSIKLGSGAAGASTDVSGALAGAVASVLVDERVRDKVDASTLTTVVANLGCGSSCGAAPAGSTPPPPSVAATAIAAAKLLFGEMKSDLSAMFSRQGASSIATGAANVQAFRFEAAMRDVDVPVQTLLRDSGALLMGIDLYNDFKAGRSANTRARAPGDVPNDGRADYSGYGATSCGVYQDAATAVLATSAANANFVGCSARYFISRSFTPTGNVTHEYRHGFTITPAADGSFGWQSRARDRVTTCTGNSCSTTANVALQTDAAGQALDPFTGSVSVTLSNGSITAFTMAGDLPGAFGDGTKTLVNHKNRIALSGTRSIDASSPKTGASQISGSLVAMDAAGVTLSTLTLKNGETKEAPVSADRFGNIVAPGSSSAVGPAGGEPTAVTLNLQFTTASAEFEGVFAITESAWDRSGTLFQPTRARLSGALRNIAGGVSTEFLSGTLQATTTGYAEFDARLPRSASNKYTMDASFVGSVTAPSRPLLELSFGGTLWMDGDEGSTRSVTVQYRSVVAGTPRLVVGISGERNPVSGEIDRFKLSEAGSGLSMSWLDGATSIDLVHGDGLVVGNLNVRTGVLTFSDGSFISLDIGL